jgi:hypothetical protein
MNTARCLKIAQRLHLLLVAELGVGLDAERMVDDPLYARDVLLVADAYTGDDLATLSAHFREAAAEKPSLAQALGASPAVVPAGLALGARQSTLNQGPKKRPGTGAGLSASRLFSSIFGTSGSGASSGTGSNPSTGDAALPTTLSASLQRPHAEQPPQQHQQHQPRADT